MNISWGTRIAILYIGFVVMIVSLVTATFFTKTDLVADDYYHQETVFQQRIDAAQASNSLNDSVVVTAHGGMVDIHFPEAFSGQEIKANVHFYAPANATADRLFDQKTTDNNLQIAQNKLAAAPYEVQVSWQAGGKDYYNSVALNLRP